MNSVQRKGARAVEATPRRGYPPEEQGSSLSWLATLELKLARWFMHEAQQQTRERALRRALRTWAAMYPSWSESLIDPHFVRGRGAEALASRDPVAMARAWTTQFFYHDEARRTRDIRQLVPVFEALLELLAAEEARAKAEVSGLLQAEEGGSRWERA
jgi:hypothetical protein